MRSLRLFSLVGVTLCFGILLSNVAFAASDYKANLAVAEADFELGEFENALAELQSALDATDEHKALAQIHLLRARCYSGLGNQESMRETFISVLEHDPLMELDPEEVSPTLVQFLKDLRETLKAEISVRTNLPGALVLLDGKNIGVAPLRTKVPIGSHEFELRDPGGVLFSKKKVLIRARQDHELYIPLEDAKSDQDDFISLADSSSDLDGNRVDVETDTMRGATGDRAGRPPYFLIDVRYTLGGAFGSAPEGLTLDDDLRLTGVELGFGVSGRDLLAMVAGTFDGSTFGATVKFGFRLSRVFSVVGFQGSIDVPMVFPDGNFYLGAGASLGLNVALAHFLEIFLEGSYRYFFVTPSTEKIIEDEGEFFGNNLWGVSLGLRFFL